MPSTVIIGCGHCVPSRVITNTELAKDNSLNTSDAWITEHTGIRQRRLARRGSPAETTTSLALGAATAALAQARLKPADLDFILVSTITPDTIVPSVSCRLQTQLGLTGVPALDLSASCAGFIHALEVARGLMHVPGKGYNNILVVGADRVSTVTNWSDRRSCVLYGDGAGAVVLKKSILPNTGILDTQLGSDASGEALLTLPSGGTIAMNGRKLGERVIASLTSATRALMARQDLRPADIDWVVPQQSSSHVIHGCAKQLDLPLEKFIINLDRYANTSSASIPLALSEAVGQGKIKKGHTVLMMAAGGGLSWGAALLR